MGRTVVTDQEVANRRRYGGDSGAPEKEEADKYVDRLIKYIPPEVIAAYTTVHTIIEAANTPHQAVLNWVVFLVILAATPFYLFRVAGVKKALQIVVCTVAYVAWAISFPGLPFSSYLSADIRAVIIVLSTFLLPLLQVGYLPGTQAKFTKLQ